MSTRENSVGPDRDVEAHNKDSARVQGAAPCTSSERQKQASDSLLAVPCGNGCWACPDDRGTLVNGKWVCSDDPLFNHEYNPFWQCSGPDGNSVATPYGKWICRDGREVLFDRQYHPIWQRSGRGEPAVPADPQEWVSDRVEQVYYYSDATPFEVRQKLCGEVLREWGVARLRDQQVENPDDAEGLSIYDFVAYMPAHNYIHIPSHETWPASSVNARIEPHAVIDKETNRVKVDAEGEPVILKASAWLDQERPVEQTTWAPGEDKLIRGRLTSNGGWIKHPGATVFNFYRPPTIETGDPDKAKPWLYHLEKIYPYDADHIVLWFAWRVQHPEVKINHALVLGSNDHGIGKDTLIEPIKRAVGHWNFNEASPQKLMGRFTGFLKAVILRVNEVRDLGETSRYQFYDHMKACTAAPPDMLPIDEKFLREYHIANCVGIIYTTNHKTNGIYLPPEDRRHYVAWSECKKEDFGEDYWSKLWGFYDNGGYRHVAAFLRSCYLKNFDPKAPPPKTRAFYDIVDANRAGEDSEIADVIDSLGNPQAFTIEMLADKVSMNGARGSLYEYLTDRKNRRLIPHRLENCGYSPVRNDTAKSDGLWTINGRRQVVYSLKNLSVKKQNEEAKKLKDRYEAKPAEQATQGAQAPKKEQK
jgi:Family of unknown function (DUF5906)